jgi:hypothetical protein
MTEVERIYLELAALRELTAKAESPSDLVAFESIAAKALLLAAASYFERRICDAIETTARETGASAPFVNFLSKQGLERRYHQLFDWEKPNVNRFLGWFGPDCKKMMEEDIKADDVLPVAIKDFMYLGSQRNQLVHKSFASFLLEVSMIEIWAKYQSASRFVDWFPKKLADASAPKKFDADQIPEKEGEQ